MVQGTLLSFENTKLEADYRAEWAAESYSADCGLYMLSFSLWILIWHTLYSAVDQRSLWAAANALMCACTLIGMRCAARCLHCHCCMRSMPCVSCISCRTMPCMLASAHGQQTY